MSFGALQIVTSLTCFRMQSNTLTVNMEGGCRRTLSKLILGSYGVFPTICYTGFTYLQTENILRVAQSNV